MSSEKDFNGRLAAEETDAGGHPSSGSARDQCAEALVRLAETQQEHLATLRELGKRIAVLERGHQEKLESRRLALELRAARSEPRLALGWIATPLKRAVRKVLGRAKYRKLDFQLELERSFEWRGIPGTIAWAESAVQRGDVAADVAYLLLLPALIARNDGVSAAELVRRLRERLGSDASKQGLLKRLERELAEPTPKIHGGRIVWRSDIGPRSHELALPSNSAGRAAWDRVKSLQGLRLRPSTLTALTLGNPKLTQIWGDSLAQVESSATTWRQDLATCRPDLFIIDLKALGTRESIDLNLVAEASEAVSATPVLWVGVESLPDEGESLNVSVPTSLTTFVDTSATARRLFELGVEVRAHRLGAIAGDRFDELPPRQPIDTLFVLDVSDDGDSSLAQALRLALPEWSIVVWPSRESLGTSAEPPHVSNEGLAPGQSHADGRARQAVVVSGSVQTATLEQQARLIQVLTQGAALFTPAECLDTFDPPLSQAPAVRFDSVGSLLSTLGDWDQKRVAFARQEQLGTRFAREHLTRAAARARFVAHAGVPSIGTKARRVSVLCVSNRPDRARDCLEAFKKQTYPHKELIFVANLDHLDDAWVERFIGETSGVTLLRTNADHSLGESLNRARAVASGEVWAKFDDDDHYGDNYLRDSMLALEHSEAAVAGKGTFFCHLKDQDKLYVNPQSPENSWVSRFVHGGTLVADRRAVEGIEFQPVRQGTDSLFLQHCRLQGLRIYSGDRYNFAYIRYATPGHHTYGVSNESYLRSCRHVSDGFDPAIVDV